MILGVIKRHILEVFHYCLGNNAWEENCKELILGGCKRVD